MGLDLSKQAKVRLVAIVGVLLMVGPVVVLVLGSTVLSDQIDAGVPRSLQESGSNSGTATPQSTTTQSRTGPTCGGTPVDDISCVEIANTLSIAVAVDLADRTVHVDPRNRTEIAVSHRITSRDIEVRNPDTGDVVGMTSYSGSSETFPRHHTLVVDTAYGNRRVEHRTRPINTSSG